MNRLILTEEEKNRILDLHGSKMIMEMFFTNRKQENNKSTRTQNKEKLKWEDNPDRTNLSASPGERSVNHDNTSDEAGDIIGTSQRSFDFSVCQKFLQIPTLRWKKERTVN